MSLRAFLSLFLPGRAATLSLALVLFHAGPALAETFHLASLEWPPYASAREKDGGTSTRILRQAFDAAGASLVVDFLPWERAVVSGTTGAGYVGYGPEYYDRSLDAEVSGTRCLYSRPFQRGPLGFVMRRDRPLEWQDLPDLVGKHIGVVSGYMNTAAFDGMVVRGTVRAETAPDDVTNVRKVALGRLDAAVIDSNVLDYLLQTVPDLAPFRTALTMSTPLLAQKELFVCFRNDASGRAAREVFNSGLASLPGQ
ncbi:substrate-binding periplasmic protein [Radicibacter daui]|uniref:substrate-binding periplasmic protein n=1 Tax=Radicibacter daui TaxID=3064829 RepID=UPI004046AE6A